jgi:hypothetical protein
LEGKALDITQKNKINKKCGLYQISLELTGGDDSLKPLQSLILVEEPVTELELTGPSVVKIKGYVV